MIPVPEDPKRPGRDALGVLLTARGHYIHQVLVTIGRPVSPQELGEKAELIAKAAGATPKQNTFSSESTRNHLDFLKKKGFVEQLPNKLWQFTEIARRRINDLRGDNGSSTAVRSSPP